MRKGSILSILVAVFISVAACGGRSAPATQPTPKAFDPRTSDLKSLAAVDDMIAALGGAGKWAAVKQLRWEQKYYYDGEVKSYVRHAWDMWNGRHRFELANMDSYRKMVEFNDPDVLEFSVAMYDLFNRRGAATYGGKEVGTGDKKKIIKTAYEHFGQQAYPLTMFYKLKDPGVKLEYNGQNKDVEVKGVRTICQPACDMIKVTFVSEVGDDTYWVYINTGTKMPDAVEKEAEAGRVGHALGNWTEVKGLKFPQEFQNVAMPGEIIKIEKIRIGSPDDSLYIPRVKPAS